jgi:hypothetical protein
MSCGASEIEKERERVERIRKYQEEVRQKEENKRRDDSLIVSAQVRAYEAKKNADVGLLKNAIVYDDNFKPFLKATLKNNTEVPVVAIELRITGQACSEVVIRKKLKLLPKQIVSIKESIQVPNACLLEKNIEVGTCIFSNGQRKDMSAFFDVLSIQIEK